MVVFDPNNLPIDNGILNPVSPTDPAYSNGRRTWMLPFGLTIEIVSTLLLGIRLISRSKRLGGSPGLDDILITIGWLLGLGMVICCIYGAERLGWDVHMLHSSELIWHTSAMVTLIAENFFMFSLMSTKLSVLLFYKRLVKGTYSNQFKWAVWIGMAFAIVATLVPWILLMTSCTPFEAIWMQWDLTYIYENAYKFHCRKIHLMVEIGRLCGILSVLTDLYSLMLPTILLFRLQMNRRQRWALMCIFGVGYSVVAAGGVRTYYLSQAEEPIADKSWILYTVWISSIVECNVAVICACAPSLNFVFGKFFRDVTSLGSSKLSSWASSGRNGRSPGGLKGSQDTEETGRASPDTALIQQLSLGAKGTLEKDPTSFNETAPVFDAAVSELPAYARSPTDPFGPVHRPLFHPGSTLAVPQPTIADDRSGASSFFFIDQDNGEDKLIRARYRGYIEDGSSSQDERSSGRAAKTNAEVARQQVLSPLNYSHRRTNSLQGTTAVSNLAVPPAVQRPQTATSAAPASSGFGPGQGSVANAIRNMRSGTSQSRDPPIASETSPTSNHRSNISYISDPSESGSDYGDAEPEQRTPYKKPTPAAAAATTTTTTTTYPQASPLQSTSSRTNPMSRSAEHVHASGSPIASSRNAGPYVIREVTVSRRSGPRPASSGASTAGEAATAVQAAGARAAARVETPDPEQAIGVAVPWTPDGTEPRNL